MLSLVAPLFLIAVPAILARGSTASRILLASGLAWAVVGVIEWALTAAPLSEILPRFATQDAALHDTYYVVSHVQVALGTAIGLLALGAVSRWLDTASWTLLAWSLQISLVIAAHLGNVVFHLVSLPISDTFALAVLFDRLNLIVTVASALSVLATLALVAGVLFSLAARLLRR